SELFGHVKGAFTGAVSDKKGYFMAADGGTLLIDEVGDMPLDVQVKLLSALESRTVTPVGSTKAIRFDTRIITATNADLGQLVAAKKFRSDLYYRIRPCLIVVPPLRERKNDFPLLTAHIIKNAGGFPRTLNADALTQMQHYDWPGNFRELRFCIEQILNEYPEARCIHAGHLHLPEPKRGDLQTVQGGTDPAASRSVDGGLREIAGLLADKIAASLEKTRQVTGQNPDGRSVARAMALLEGRDFAESGPGPGRKFKKLLKFILAYAPESFEEQFNDPFFASFVPQEERPHGR
ncbi:MAG: sigma-54-dependent Fis family transcriptional regulator, partial [Lentisphaeria bacterium]|nr:sigma-54-dependent Fis family transcriptional regulator [Lentisphaeria bacterium]